MIEIKSIRFVKRAKMWCLSYSMPGTKKENQKQEWCHTLEEAERRARELKKD